MAKYDDLLDGTVSEVEDRLDGYSKSELRDILKAEKKGKDRKTLKESIQSAMESAPESGASPSAGRRKMLGLGLVIGIAAALLAITLMPSLAPTTSVAGDTITAAQAENTVNSYLQDNKAALRLPPNSTVETVGVQDNGAYLYEVTTSISFSIQGQEQSQEVPVFVTKNGRYLFLGQVYDTTQPLSEQLQQPQAGTQ